MASEEILENCSTSVKQSLKAVEEHIQTITASSYTQFQEDASAIDKAKLHVSLAYTINALLYVYLQTRGIPSEDSRHVHVKHELERVKAYISRIKKVNGHGDKAKLKLDVNASKRMIQNALSKDQVYIDNLKQDSVPADEKPIESTDDKGKRKQLDVKVKDGKSARAVKPKRRRKK